MMAYEPPIIVVVNATFSRYVIADRQRRRYWRGTDWTDDIRKALLYAHAEVRPGGDVRLEDEPPQAKGRSAAVVVQF